MKANFTTPIKTIARACALALCLGFFSGNLYAQAPFEGGRTYWVDGTGNDLVSPKDTFANLSGAYGGGAYTATTGILNALTVNGSDINTTGTITIVLTSGYTGTEAGSIGVGNATTGGYPNMSLSRPVLLTAASGQSFTITTSGAVAANAALFRFNGIQHFTIDGESTAGQRNLSFVMSGSSTQPTSRVIDIIPFTNNGCNSVAIRNCNIKGFSSTTAVNTFAGVYLGNTSAPSNALRRSQNITVHNNVIEAVQTGVYIRGIGTTINNHDLGLTVTNNTIGGTVAPNTGSPTTFIGGTTSGSNNGIVLIAQANATVSGNIIRNNMAAAGGFRGISLFADGTTGTLSIDSNITINANKIYNLFSTATNNPVYGIRFTNTTNHANPYNITISNNTIAKLQSTLGGTAPNAPNYTIGVSIEDVSVNAGFHILHNSIHLYGDTLNTNGNSACLFLSASVTGGVNVLNNIFVNRMGKVISGSVGNNSTNYAIVALAAAGSPFASINNNNYYVTTARGGNAFIGYGLIASVARPRVSINHWRAYTGGDANSMTDIPPFIGVDDSTCTISNGAGSRLGNAATSTVGVATDINGVNRPGGNSNSIGAYQFSSNFSLANYPLNGGRVYPINGVNSWPLGTNGNGSFATVSDAVNYLNSYGVTGTGTVRLVLSSGYNKLAEGYIPHIIDYPGAASSRPVSLSMASGYSDTIMLPNTSITSNHSAIFRFIGTQFFELNGSASGSTKDLTLLIPSNVTNNSVKLVAITPSENSSVSDISIRNCVLSGNSTTSAVNTSAAIYMGHHTPATTNPPFASALSGNNTNITLANNSIEAVRTGIYLRNMNGAGMQTRNVNVIGNVIGGVIPPLGSSRTTFVGGIADQAGVYLKGIANALVDSNTIRNPYSVTTVSNGFRGIDLDYALEAAGRDSNITVSRNFIYNLITQGQYCLGIRINLANDSLRMIRLINNSIANIRGTGAGAAPSTFNPAGILVDATVAIPNYGLELYYNTINLNGSTLTGANSSYGVFFSSNIRGGVRMRNNNITNKLGRASGSGNVFAVMAMAPVATSPFATPNGVINSNNYVAAAPASTNFIGAANNGANTYAGLVNWQAFTAQDAISLSANVGFLNDSMPDLDATFSAPLFNAGVPVVNVLGDIYGNSRGVSATCIGAVEFSQVYLPLAGNQSYLINGVNNPPRVGGTAPFTFSTINKAFQYINANGVDNNTGGVSPINLIIANGYAGEGDTLISPLVSYPRANANRPITLKPDVGRNDTIKTAGGSFGAYALNGSVLRLNGASHFTIDGSNNGTDSRNLTIMLPPSANNTSLKIVDLAATSQPNTFITIKNCNIIGNSTTTAINTFAGIYMGGVTTPSNSSVSGNNNNTFHNNFIGAVRYGIYLRGAANTATQANGAQDFNTTISKNMIGGNTAPGGSFNTDYFGGVNDAAGIFLSAQAQALVDSNTIKNNYRSFTNNRGIELSAISSPLLSLDSAITISRNNIYNIFNQSSTGGAYGIYANIGSLPTNNQSRRFISITNNMIAGIAAPGTAQTNSASIFNPYGIFVDAGTSYADVGISILYNSINLGTSTAMSQSNSVSSCLMFNTNVRGGVTLRNNILQNRLGRAAGSGYAFAVLTGAPTTIFTTIDNNNYFVNAPGTTVSRILASNSGVNYTTTGLTTISNLRSFTGQDLYSIDFVTPFTNDTNLFIPNSTASVLWAGAAPITGLTRDIIGGNRDAFTPTIGAHEYLGTYTDSVAPLLLNATPPASLCSNGPFDIIIRTIERTLTSDTLYYTVNGGAEQFVLVNNINGENRTYTIPAQPNNANIRYRVVVRDNSAQQFVGTFPATGYDNIGTVFTTLPVANGFDGAAAGWSVEQVFGNGNWVLNQIGGSAANPSLGPITGVRAAVFPSSTLPNGTASRIISPCIDFNGRKAMTLRMWVSQNSDLPNIQDRIQIYASPGFGTWAGPLATYSRVNNTFAFPGYRQIDVCLAAFHDFGNVKIAIEAVAGGNGNNIIIDSIIIFDDIQTVPVTPLVSNLCSSDPISLNIASSNTQYSYTIINTYTALPLNAAATGTGSPMALTANNPNVDSILVNVQYKNLLTAGQGTECMAYLPDTAKIYVSRYFGGPFAAKGTTFTGAYNNGTSIDPDGAIVGDTLQYNIVAPSGLSYASYGTRWTVTSNQVQTINGTPISSSTYTAPSTSGAGLYVVRPGAADGDSTFVLAVNYRLMPTNCDSLVTRYIKITSAPTTFFTNGRDSVCAGTPLAFTNNSTGSPATLPLSYSWTFGDNTTSNLSEPTKTWNTPGQYIVTLETTNNAGIKRSFQKTITVLTVPVASFNNGLVCSNDSVTLTNTSTGTGLTHNWAYSLGNVVFGNSTLENPKAFFATVDTTYKVRLTVTNNVGCTNSFERTVYVFPRPVASFTTNAHCNGVMLPVINNSTIPSTKSGNTFGSEWSFGNGNTGLSNNPVYTYPASGSYVIRLKVTSNFGCIDSTSQPVTVHPKPQAGYTFTNACQSDSIKFNNTTTFVGGLTNVSYRWNFGDNTPIATAATPGKMYGALGTFNVKLVATESTNGCADSVTQAVTINEKPVAGFTAAGGTNKGCVGAPITFNNGSFGPFGSTLTYAWAFGDGNNSTATAPTHTYTSAGAKPVALIVTAGGCKDTAMVMVSINNSPVPTITYTVVNNSTMTFRFNATPSGMAKYTWDFKDGGTKNTFVDSVNNTYTSAGTYAPTVTVTDANGCVGSAQIAPAIVINTVGVNEELAAAYGLSVYPNPFTTNASIDFRLNKPSTVSIRVFDMIGRTIAQADKGTVTAGNQSVSLQDIGFNGTAGAYMVQIQIDGVIITKQIIQQN